MIENISIEILAFWLLSIAAAWSYFIYPLVLLLLPGRKRQYSANSDLPSIAVIITVHNEQVRILEKLTNCAEMDYPKDKLELIIASDASTDNTHGMVENFRESQEAKGACSVRLVVNEAHDGKEAAQILAASKTTAAVLVFTDVATVCEPSALHAVVEALTENGVAAVSSEDAILGADGNVQPEGMYVRYEMWLRRLEANQAGLIGVSGSLFAIRSELVSKWDTETASDFNSALCCHRNGQFAISSSKLLGMYPDTQDPSKEFQRKVRTVLRGMRSLQNHRYLLHPKHGKFAFQLWSHKIMRWAIPVILPLYLATSCLVATDSWIYATALLAQLGFYATALLGHLVPNTLNSSIVRTIYYFVQVNIATLVALSKLLSGKHMLTWTPTVR